MKNYGGKLDGELINALRALPGAGAELSREQVAELQTAVGRPLKAVRPLPANGWLALGGVLLFSGFCLLVAAAVGLEGWHHLSIEQKLFYFAGILATACVASWALALELVPGSERRSPPGAALAIALGMLAIVVVRLFPLADFDGFVKVGIHCLRLGLVCAAVSGGLSYWLLRIGISTTPLRTAALGGLAAGLAGFGVLALYCPVQSYTHILVWHGGAVAVACVGALLLELAIGPRGRIKQ